jgi:hypothetical protein
MFFLGGKKRGDVWHAQEIVRLNVMMAVSDCACWYVD